MRVAVIFVAVVVATTPASASASCMSIGEARHHFGGVHLYWHGSDHCWDASPGRHRIASKTQDRPRAQNVREPQLPKWRDARSELVADNEPAPALRETGDQSVATPDTPPVTLAPIKLASILADWSERWVDVEQVVPDRLINAPSILLAAPASEQKVDLILVAHGLALFTFGFGLVLTFVALLMRSGTHATGPPAMDNESHAPPGFAAGHADESSLRTDSDNFEAKPRSSTAALPALVTLGGRWLGTARHFAVVLISRQVHFICWTALQWGRHIGGFISDGSYPMEVKWPSESAGAMISKEDVSRPFTVPSRLLEETRQAASRAVSPPALPAPRVKPS